MNLSEDYEELAESLQDIMKEVNSLKTITVDDTDFSIELFLGADLKFLATVVGIQSTNATYVCMWCKCPADKRYDTSVQWSITDTNKGARTIDEIKQFCSRSSKCGVETFGCIKEPIFSSTPIDHVIPDILHLFLRISDVLTNLLILELRRLDGIEKQVRALNRDKATNVTQYEHFLNHQCKISFQWYVNKESKALQWRDLTGPEKLRVFQHINIPDLFPRLPEAHTTQKLWVDFMAIYNFLRKSDAPSSDEINNFEQSVHEWLELFLSLFQTKHVTPYIHVLISHVPNILRQYGSLAPFSQQGLEKLNDDLTKSFFSSTNHRDLNALQQMLLKLNRIKELSDNDRCRVKRVHVCKVCKKPGHNARTCKSSST